MLNKTTLKSLVVPGGLLLFGVSLVAYSGWNTWTLPALSFLYYCALIGGMLLAWRFHSTRSFVALLVLFLARELIILFGDGHFSLGTPGWTAVTAFAVLVPIDFVLVAFMDERGFSRSTMVPVALTLFVQFTVVSVLCRAAEASGPIAAHTHQGATNASLPGYCLIVFALAVMLLLARFLFTCRLLDSALLWSLAAFFLSLRFFATTRVSLLYAAAAACVLAVSIIENSYLLAYHDELTALPSRRAFNDALLGLQAPYSIAVVDIDHFKRFNDTYGHDVGDEVLRLVAANLARVTGGGQAFRCGGEEFNILFAGKTTEQVCDHLERLRASVESSEFRLRGNDRRRIPRGPERRNPRNRVRKGDVIRELSREPASPLSVTISIGVATALKEETDPEQVLQLADKALYRAKANGRNRVETASPKAKRSRLKAAGIA